MECVVPIINGLQVEQIVVVDLVIIIIEPFQFVNLNILLQTFRYFANYVHWYYSFVKLATINHINILL